MEFAVDEAFLGAPLGVPEGDDPGGAPPGPPGPPGPPAPIDVL